jgi:short-subunit dehydrogenase
MAYTFISGATGGIGKAFARECAKRGFDLFLTGRKESNLIALKELILRDYAVKIDYFACDLASESSRKEMLEFIDEKGYTFNRILLVAGVDIQKGFLDYTEQKLLFQMRVNCESTVALAYALLKRREKVTELLTVASMSGASPMPYFALYSATKAMLINFFTAMHYELKDFGVKVTVVMPGGVPARPDIIEDIKGQGLWGRLSQKSPEFVARKSLDKLKKNKLKYIPGGFNKFLNFIMSILPKSIVLRFIKNRWKKQTKDAF